MGGGGVYVGEGEVGFAHVEGGVAEQILEGVDVSAIAEEQDGEGVAEAVTAGVFDAGAVGDVDDEAAELGAVEGFVFGGNKGGLGGLLSVGTFGEVFPEGGGGFGGDGEQAFFYPLTVSRQCVILFACNS